jgi:5-methylcytosine-specific restriction endonuclease McrA
MKKSDRQKIFDKYNGRCAYCGEKLQKGWHVDELLPCRRNYKWIPAHYIDKNTRKIADVRSLTENELTKENFQFIQAKNVLSGYSHPERLHIDNQMPACPSCNINKHSMDLENFRDLIENFTRTLNENSVQYKIAKRYGLIKETPKKKVVFYFESL